MNRFLLATALVAFAPTVAFADDPPPTAAQLDAAKKAFAEGKKLHDQGKLLDAVSKFQESYRLSKKPTLLYNIAVTMEEAKENDLALVYYRKFLADAPADAVQREEVMAKVKDLEKGLNLGTTTNPPPTNPPTPVEPKVDPATEHNASGKIKPPGTYKETDFQHQIVEDAPPGKPLDVSAFVPEDSGWTVTLYFRGAGDDKFNAKPMKWHYKQLIARIPANKVSGSSIQYYVEARDATNKEVARAGKSTSPNLINLDPGATAHFFPDFTDNVAASSGGGTDVVKPHRPDEEDPFHKSNTPNPIETPIEGPTPVPGGGGAMDPNSSTFKYIKIGTTIGAGALLAGSVVLYLAARGQASNIVDDSKTCPGGGTPPCRQYDSTDKSYQDAGQSRQLFSRITFGVGLGAAAVAGYFWYRGATAKHEAPATATTPNSTGLDSLIIAPSIGDGYVGAAAAARF